MITSCLPAEGDGGEDGGESGGSVERRLGGRGGRLEEVSSRCRHITVQSAVLFQFEV